jgi:DNA-binding GntR family transcriptional regulator
MQPDMINRASGVPPWEQLLASLYEQIEAGTLPGTALPGERHLAAQYGISPSSVRKALGALRADGWVKTTPGYGSRVLTPEERAEQKRTGGKPGDT